MAASTRTPSQPRWKVFVSSTKREVPRGKNLHRQWRVIEKSILRKIDYYYNTALLLIFVKLREKLLKYRNGAGVYDNVETDNWGPNPDVIDSFAKFLLRLVDFKK